MDYETIAIETLDYGKNKFLEVSKKKAMPDENVFLNISKGYYTPDGEKRYQRGIGFPDDAEFVSQLVEKLQAVSGQ